MCSSDLASHLLRTRPSGAQLAVVARWNWWLGTAASVLTFAAGLQAYYSVAHDAPAHAAMTIHLKWASAALAAFMVTTMIVWRDRERPAGASAVLGVALAVATGALLVTGYLGAENVYRHGLGVMRLPQAEGTGHDHSHAAAEGDHDAAAAAEPAASAPVAHHHDPQVVSHTAQVPAATVDAYFAALKAGDLAKAGAYLDPDVRIFESGGVERSAQEYAGHHMPADAAFLKAASQEITARTGDAIGDLAWGRVRTAYQGRLA